MRLIPQRWRRYSALPEGLARAATRRCKNRKRIMLLKSSIVPAVERLPVPQAGDRPVKGGAGIGGAVDSNAPMSHAAPWGRLTPRWSLVGGGHGPPASIAGLPAC